MTSDQRWELIELADAGVSVFDCEHKTPPDAGRGHPYIAIPNLVDGRLDLSSVRRITDEDLSEWTRRTRPQGGDVIVTRRGRVGDSAVVPEGLNCAIGQNLVILRSDGSRVHQEFLRWATRGPAWHREVDRLRNVGAVFDSLNVRDIARLRIAVPPLPVQRALASVLTAVDDKTEVNRRIARTLEQIAATIFKARFVDFVGVEKFEDSELGPIPKGWEVKAIGDALTTVGGATPSTKDPTYWDGGEFPWATPKDLSGHLSPVLLETSRHLTQAGVDKISSGALPAGTVLLSSRAPIGYTVISKVAVSINQGFIAFPPDDVVPAVFILFWLRENLDRIKSAAGGTTFAEISKRAFRPLKLVMPPPAELWDFGATVSPLIDQIAALDEETKTLEALRDTLLPKLISGEIRVPEGFGPDSGAEELLGKTSREGAATADEDPDAERASAAA